MTTRIRRYVETDTGHRVPNHKSMCRHMHGHRYRFEAEIEGVHQCDKCREMSSYLFELHRKFHPDQEFDTCDICYTKKFKLGLLHLSVHTKLLQVNKPAQNVQLNQIVKVVETDSSDSSCKTTNSVQAVNIDKSEKRQNKSVTDVFVKTDEVNLIVKTDINTDETDNIQDFNKIYDGFFTSSSNINRL